MTSRRTRVRSTVAALLASLIALWVFAGYETVAGGLRLWATAELDARVAAPIGTLVVALQDERRLSAVQLGGGQVGGGQVGGGQAGGSEVALAAARSATDRARAALPATGGWPASAELDAALGNLGAELNNLGRLRTAIDGFRTVPIDASAGAITGYTMTIAAAFAVDDTLPQVVPDATTAIALARAQELLAQEDTVVSRRLAAGPAVPDSGLGLLVGAQRTALADQTARLTSADAVGYQNVLNSPALYALAGVENSAMAGTVVSADQWRAAADPALAQLSQAQQSLRGRLHDQLWPKLLIVLGELLLVVALGFVAIFASLNISIITTRRLQALRDAADGIAARLPGVVERIAHGEPAVEAPPLVAGGDEIGQVGAAFNRMQATAVRVATEQAELRRGVRDVFLSLARRSQSLLHRQLGLLDAMERRATTPDALAELFRVDHLATRMRRNAENLIVLNGATAGRTWRRPVPIVDVLRAALAEIEDFSRVTVVPPASAALVGPAVGDVIHLLAELVENAVSFSPPQTTVRVTGAMAGDGFVIEVEDRGLGMTEQHRTEANQLLGTPHEFTFSGSGQLGLYVVSQLAARQAVGVELRESAYGGTTAVVTLPGELITEAPPTGRARAIDALAPVSAPRSRTPGPSRSEPAAIGPTGLPVRRRPADPQDAKPVRPPLPALTPQPLPGLALGPDGRSFVDGDDEPDTPLWTPSRG
jgi:signal transduction histidine kinase